MPCEPQALIPTAAARAAATLTRIFATRLMRAEMIRIMTPVMLLRASATAPRWRLLALALIVAATLGGCGESSATYHSSVLTLRVSEYEISPESVRMPAGAVRIRLTNDGVLVHEVAIANGDGRIVGQTGTVFPGHTATSAQFTLAPGTYRMYDPGANYADLGAYGSLSVS
jgi:hypothetical protein